MTIKTKSKRYNSNPFMVDMIIPSATKKVQLSRLGKDNNVLINQNTGEMTGTHVTTYKKVDAAKFVKLFAQNIALTFDLKASGIKAFNVLIWAVQNKTIEKDLVCLDKYTLEDFLVDHSDREPPIKLSLPTFWRGLADLEEANIVAKNIRQGWYFINPNFVFNGDRIAFTTLIEKEKIETS
ncbi:replication/maintenance protein RepL [Piscirickettsia salmonis]|uniref:replication/maintenance protein RepL n=1 Tax=Piscirickettsia salmonis TaxID=1238 RepID=UPI003EBCC2E5